MKKHFKGLSEAFWNLVMVHTQCDIFILLSREWIRSDVTDRLWYRDSAVSINLLLNATENPICVDDLQGTHLINNLVAFSSQNAVCPISAVAFLFCYIFHLSCVQHGVSSDWPCGAVESEDAVASLFFWQYVNTFRARDSLHQAHITWFDHSASRRSTTKIIRWVWCALLCA